MPTPRTDHAFTALSASEIRAVDTRDRMRLELERTGVAPHVAASMSPPTHSLLRMMREWELLVIALDESFMQHTVPGSPAQWTATAEKRPPLWLWNRVPRTVPW